LKSAACSARELETPPVGVEPASGADCLSAAKALMKATPGAKLVLGVVTEVGRAWPHAWVQERSGRNVDPTLPPDDPRLSSRRYLVFPKDAGSLYLALLSGRAQVQWVEDRRR
jgi:hypothetical protein